MDYDGDERINVADLVNFYSELFWKENEDVEHFYSLEDITTLSEAYIGKFDKEGFNSLSFETFQDVSFKFWYQIILEDELKIWMNIQTTAYIYIPAKP